MTGRDGGAEQPVARLSAPGAIDLVCTWPLFTASMTSVERLDRGPFQSGSQARIKQPSLPTIVWTVTDFQPLRQFTWTVTSAGVTTVATHALSPGPAGSVILTLWIDRTGVLAPVIDLLYAGLTRRYIAMEAEGISKPARSAPRRRRRNP